MITITGQQFRDLKNKMKWNYKLSFCHNSNNYIIFIANFFDSGSIYFWQEVDRGVYLKPLIKRNLDSHTIQ